ncbi:AAA family ATPase [Verrucomicrobiota bacterium sgz303538]
MPLAYLSEVFRIIEGALRLDGVKVRNYAELLAEKLSSDGDSGTAQRIRKLLNDQSSPLRPTKLIQEAPPPVDGESRFPLVQRLFIPADAGNYVFTEAHQVFIREYLAVVQSRATLEAKGISCSSNLLLYGPPGCGKTRLAIYIGHRLSLPVYVARLDGLISSFLGSTAKNIRAVFEFATKTPCVLLLDEFDAVAKLRDDQQELGELKRVVNSFIQNLDSLGSEIILIAATNHEQLLDPAVWRRFPFLLHVALPDHAQRERLWNAFSGDIKWDAKQLWALADLTEGFSGADIEAASLRLRQAEVTQGITPSVRGALTAIICSAPAGRKIQSVINAALLEDDAKLEQLLRERDPRAYSMSLIAEVLGISKATMSRRKRVPKQQGGSVSARRTPIHQGSTAEPRHRETKAGRRG